MLLAVIALAAGALAGWLAGRRPRPAQAWRVPALVPVAALLLLAGGPVLGGDPGLAAMAAGYAALAGFAVANGRHPGMVVAAVGLLANLAVMLADGGMPVRGQPAGVQIGDHHHGLSTRDDLAGLADTIRIAPLGEMVSPGDLLVAGGGAIAGFFWFEPVGTPRRPGRSRARLPL